MLKIIYTYQYKGLEIEEPEYEGIAAFGPLIMQEDYGSVVHLNTLADGLGMDANELGWIEKQMQQRNLLPVNG